MFNMCQLLVLKNELHLTALNIKTSLDGSNVLPWQVMCISCLLFGVRWGAASTWSMPTTKRAFLQCNKVPASFSHKGCSSTELYHIQHKLPTAVLTRWKLLSHEIPQETLSPLLGSLAYMCWCSEEPVTSINRVEMERTGSSEALEQKSLHVHEPWYLRSQTSMTAHFSTTVSTSPDCPFQYHHVSLLWLVLTNHNELTWLSQLYYYCRDHS